tara:strand:- start:3192 stop:3860 length:669 start_codon:yes stop_codon:yes gene_type:complete
MVSRNEREMIDSNLMNKFKEPLINLFGAAEIKDLYEDYLDIEKQWERFFKRINSINLVIIGESPLSGKGYIYNPCLKKNHDSGTQFLYKGQLQECLKIHKRSECAIEGKGKMELMIELGLLVIEAYPYALNPEIHKRSFKKGLSEKQKKELFLRTSSWHFFNKIKKIDSKVGSQTVYAFRYIGNMRNLNSLLGLNKDIDCLGKSRGGGHIDQEKLFNIFKNL